uniref:Ndr family protein n=1 Tax=Parascaris univalens TaxID=6257 RepID=A0A914ZKX3_PARUN
KCTLRRVSIIKTRFRHGIRNKGSQTSCGEAREQQKCSCMVRCQIEYFCSLDGGGNLR